MEKGRLSLTEKPPVIIELGAQYTKFGIAGDPIPKKVCFTPTIFKKWLQAANSNEHVAPFLKKIILSDWAKEWTWIRTWNREIHSWSLSYVSGFIIFDQSDLLINPKERGIILIENAFIPIEFIDSFKKILVARFQVLNFLDLLKHRSQDFCCTQALCCHFIVLEVLVDL